MRYLVVLSATTLLVAGWNVWVVLHSDGIVRGQVLEADGRPAEGVTVIFWEKTLTTLERRTSTQTDRDGRFLFIGQAAHHFAVQAERPNDGAAPRTLYRRYFRSQNVVLAEPLRLGKGR